LLEKFSLGSETLSEKIKPILLRYGKEVAKEVTAELQPQIDSAEARAEYWQEQFEKKAAAKRMEESLRQDAEKAKRGWRTATFAGIPAALVAGAVAGFFITF
jgi:hypothetical protein